MWLGTLSLLVSDHLRQSVCCLMLSVGLPIGLGAISGIITGKTSRSDWFTVSDDVSQ